MCQNFNHSMILNLYYFLCFHSELDWIWVLSNENTYYLYPIEPSMCDTDEFQCNDGICLDLDQKCDGYPDCRNGEDESAQNCAGIDFYLF
jgi:hypothetical protein